MCHGALISPVKLRNVQPARVGVFSGVAYSLCGWVSEKHWARRKGSSSTEIKKTKWCIKWRTKRSGLWALWGSEQWEWENTDWQSYNFFFFNIFRETWRQSDGHRQGSKKRKRQREQQSYSMFIPTMCLCHLSSYSSGQPVQLTTRIYTYIDTAAVFHYASEHLHGPPLLFM